MSVNSSDNQLSKQLKARHVNMIAIGGSIGTGIFLASGYSIFVAGPGGALVAYALMALVVYFIMTSLGELSVYRPSSGSFCDYSSLYVGKSWGFAMGYNYWLNWAVTIAVEISAASLVTSYWFTNVNPVIFSAIYFVVILGCNMFSVRLYGETEYWLSLLKVSVIIVFIFLGILTLFAQPHFGLDKWNIGDAPFHQGWFGFMSVFLFAGFSFQGTELVGVAAGETKDPENSIPKAVNMVFWRLTLFYVLSIGVISLLLSYSDSRLASQDNVLMSPYTLVLSNFIGKYAADFINLIILIALISAANASMYSATRILWYLGKMGQTPKFITKVTKNGVPIFSLIFTALIGSIVFISSIVGNGVVFTYLVQVSSLSGFLAWFGIALAHYMFRRNHIDKIGGIQVLKYRAKFFPYAQVLSMIVIGFVMVAQVITLGEHYKFIDFIMIYSSVILFVAFYVGHKLFARN